MKTPPILNGITFWMEESTLFVPAESVGLYEKADHWKGFNSYGSNGIKPLP